MPLLDYVKSFWVHSGNQSRKTLSTRISPERQSGVPKLALGQTAYASSESQV